MQRFHQEIDSYFAQFMPGITRRFFYINIFVSFAFWIMLALGGRTEWVVELAHRLFILRPSEAVLQFNVWQFITSIFNHADFFHLFANMITLFFFGPLVEDRMGSRRFAWFVILGGLAGAVAHTVLAFAFGSPQVGLLGFSGAGFAILMAAFLWFPNIRVLLFFVIPIPMRVLALILGIFLAMGILQNLQAAGFMGGGVSHVAHLAGVLMGLLLVKVGGILDYLEGWPLPGLVRRGPRKVRRRAGASRGGDGERGGGGRVGLGHPGRHSDPSDLYDDPHWYLDQ